jgi:hypothetical protein
MNAFYAVPFPFYIIRQPVQSYATKTHHAIVAWAAKQRAEVDRILSRPTPPDSVLSQGDAQRVAEIEVILDDSENEYIEYLSRVV